MFSNLIVIGEGYVYLTLPFGDSMTVVFIGAFLVIFGASIILAILKKLPFV